MDKRAGLAEQYSDASNLDTRGGFNERFTDRNRHPHEWVFGELSMPPDGTLLDLGSGPGAFWEINDGRIPSQSPPVLADFSPGMVSDARNRLDRLGVEADVVVANSERLPFKDGVFDVVLALMMLYHLSDLATGLAEVRRTLSPGGCLYASTGSEENARTLFDMMAAVADGSVEPLAGGFTAENGRAQLSEQFGRIECRVFEDQVRVDDPDALVAYALSLPLDDPALSTFEPADAEELRELAARRIDNEGEIRWRKDTALFVAAPP